MEQTFSLWMVLGFLFAAYSVVANDSVQTLGTWMASTQNKFKWYYLWAAATVVLWFTIWWGWSKNGGDISYGRLNKIPFQEIQWYHATAPLILLLLSVFLSPPCRFFGQHSKAVQQYPECSSLSFGMNSESIAIKYV